MIEQNQLPGLVGRVANLGCVDKEGGRTLQIEVLEGQDF
jgi:hypothetical protein